MNGGLYRSAHAARDGDPPPPDGVTLISVDTQHSGAAAAEDQALPPEELPPAGPDAEGGTGTAGQSAIMATGSLVSRLIGFVRNALIGMTLGAGILSPGR